MPVLPPINWDKFEPVDKTPETDWDSFELVKDTYPPPGLELPAPPTIPPEARAGENQAIEDMRHPIKAGFKGIATGVDTLGRTIGNVARAGAFEATGNMEDAAAQLGISPQDLLRRELEKRVPQYTPGIEKNLPPQNPYEEGFQQLPVAGQVLSRASTGLIESTPRIGAALALSPAVGPVAAGALAFGPSEKEGFSIKNAAIAAALPFVGRYSGDIIGAIAQKFGVTSEQAVKAWMNAGAITGAAGYLATIDESEIEALPPEQRDQARIDMVAGLIGQSMLGPLGVRQKKPGPTTINVQAEVTPQPGRPGAPSSQAPTVRALPPILPEGGIDLTKPQPPPAGGPNALSVEGAGRVFQHPPEGTGEAGSQRGGVEPGQQGQAPAPAQPQASAPVSQEVTQSPVPGEIAKIQAMPVEQQVAYFRANQSRADNAAYRLGLSVMEPDDLTALEKASDDAIAKARQAKDSGDLNGMGVWGLIAQNFREAHEAATGTGSAGTFLSENVSGYEPPFPMAENQSINAKREAAKNKAAVAVKPPATPDYSEIARNEGPTAARLVKALNDIGIGTIDTHGSEGQPIMVRLENPWESIPWDTRQALMRLGVVRHHPENVVDPTNPLGEMSVTFDRDVSSEILKLEKAPPLPSGEESAVQKIKRELGLNDTEVLNLVNAKDVIERRSVLEDALKRVGIQKRRLNQPGSHNESVEAAIDEALNSIMESLPIQEARDELRAIVQKARLNRTYDQIVSTEKQSVVPLEERKKLESERQNLVNELISISKLSISAS